MKNIFLNKKNIIKFINEGIDLDSLNIDQYSMKRELNPLFWTKDNKLKPEIRKILLKNALLFIKFAKINKLIYNDILFVGSLANYNYTNYSDLDVHILMDTSQISNNKEFVDEYLDTKKSLWSEKYDIKIKGHDVEMYVQDINEVNAATGIYSLINDKWILKPIYQMIPIDINKIFEKASYIMDKIDSLESETDNNKLLLIIDKIKDKIKKLRQSGLQKEGEFSIENLVFKVLRNTGYLKKLFELKEKAIANKLSLENYNIQ